MIQLVYGLVDMQSFYASCEVATRSEFSRGRLQHDDTIDPSLVVAGDPEHRRGIILAATPVAKAKGITTAMTLGEALRLDRGLIVVKPRMELYLDISVRIQQTIQQHFPLHEQFSVDEAFFAFSYPTGLFRDPIIVSQALKDAIWDQYRIRCRIGLGPNKWVAKMANKAAKKAANGVIWWREEQVQQELDGIPISGMWGVKRRGEILTRVFGCKTIGDVANISGARLKQYFGNAWGEILYRWSHGIDLSPIDPYSYEAPNKGYSHKTTLARDFEERSEVAVVLLELLDEVCERVRHSGQKGRRISVGITYAGFDGGFHKAKTLGEYTDDAKLLYPVCLSLFDCFWNGEPVRAIAVGLNDLIARTEMIQLSLFEDTIKQNRLNQVIDHLHARFGEMSLYRASSLLPAGQRETRSGKIGGHTMG